MSSVPATLLQAIAACRDKVIAYQTQMTSIQALGPANGGVGEMAKARYLEGVLRELGISDIEHVDAPDARVPDGVRPNIVARIPGASSRTLWIMGHMDVVPTGELSQWETDPWQAVVDGDKVFGRGVQDNQQAIVGALILAGELLASGCRPDLSLGLLFVSDEENGNAYGMDYVMDARPDLFRADDFVLVPDFGVPDGSCIEIAEKGQLWLKVTAIGRQCHASRPQQGINSLVAAADMILHVKDVAGRFNMEDALFEPPMSTFVPSRHEENVPNVNTMPGRDVFYIDCRLLPGVDPDEVQAAFLQTFSEIAARHGANVTVERVQGAPAAPATSPDSEVVLRLASGIEAVYGCKPRCFGVGGGTVAATFRRMNLPAAAWASLAPTAHIANEYSLISKTLGDAQVMASMLFDAPPQAK